MKILVDEKKLARNARIARGIVLGVVAIAIGMMIAVLLGSSSPAFRNINPSMILIAEIVIIAVLFGISRIGFVYANRYLAFNRPEKVLRDSLKGLDRKYALMLFQKPTDYLLIEPGGITVLVPRGQEGAVIQAEGKWRYNRGFMRSWMGRDEAIGNPSADAQKAMADIKKVLDEKAPEIKVPLRAVIVFTHPRVALTAEPGPVTALRAEELKDYLRAAGKLHELPKSIQRKMREALGAPDVASE